MLIIYHCFETERGLYQNPIFCNPPEDVAQDDSNVVFHYAMLKKEHPGEMYIVKDKDSGRQLSKEELLKKLYRIP